MGLKKLIRQIIGPQEQAETEVEPAVDDFETEAVAVVETKIGYSFRDRKLLATALLHRSHVHVSGNERVMSNERLEFLGDSVLGLVVNEYLYRTHPERSEGDLTKMKSLLVCGARLSEIAGKMVLGDEIRMSRSEAATGGRRRSSILADTMEAIIGAVYLDGGLARAREVIGRCLIEGSGPLLKKRAFGNHKSRLQEMIQATFKSPPRYRIIEAKGPDHDRIFTVGVFFNGTQLGAGRGKSKKSAEQEAAREALARIEREDCDLEELEP